MMRSLRVEAASGILLPGEKRVRRHLPFAWLSGAERSEGTGKLTCRRPLQLQVRRAMKEGQRRFDA